MAALAWLTTVLTVVVLAFYTWNPKARNYGGSTQGLRWLFWLIPFWLLMLPRASKGARPGLGPRPGAVRPGGLGRLGRLRDPQPLEPPLDPRRAGASGSVHLEAMRIARASPGSEPDEEES